MSVQRKEKPQYKEVSFDPDKLTITAEGIEDFEFPITHREILDFGVKLEHRVCGFLRLYPDQIAVRPFKLAKKYFINTTCGLYQAELLSKRLDQKRISVIDFPPALSLWPDYLQGRIPDRTEPYVAELKNRKPAGHALSFGNVVRKLLTPKRLFQILRKANFSDNGIEIDGLKIVRPDKIDLKNGIVATQRTDIIAAHAKATEQDVYYCASSFWFSTISDEALTREIPNYESDIGKEIVAKIQSECQDTGVSLPEASMNYLARTITEIVSLLAIHYRRLAQKPLPKFLWTGTGGDIWDMMLRVAVMAQGGEVIAHDHANGIAYTRAPITGAVELWGCDQFIAYNDTQAKAIIAEMADLPHLDRQLPQVRPLPQPVARELVTREKFLSGTANIKKAMLFATAYLDDRGRSFPLFPYLHYIDWQARLISRLKEWGYDVYFKPHPESVIAPPQVFADKFDVPIITGAFEEAGFEPDLYIFDLVTTSVFAPVLRTNTPTTIIDFTEGYWHEDAQSLIQKRCGFVSGTTAEGRFYVDWQKLRQALRAAPTKCNNREFLEKYLL